MLTSELLRREFPVTESCIYLNHAAVGPWPRRTQIAVNRFAEENVAVGASNYPAWLRIEQQLRERLALLIRAYPADIALLKNTSEALSFVAQGFPWQDGDNVVISDEEFPSNRIVWESLAHRGVKVKQVGLRNVADPESALIDAMDSSTRLLSISSVQYASGLKLDLARLGQICRRKNVAFCVDAIQSLGAQAIDVDAAQIDFLMADGHKWMLGPEGVALFYCRPAWRDRLTLTEYGWHMVEEMGDYDRRDWRPAHSARRFECGSPNMLGMFALNASLELLLEMGLEKIEQHVLERTRFLLSGLARRQRVTLLTLQDAGRHAGIATFTVPGADMTELHSRLTKQRIVCAPRGGGIRLSPHFYIPLEQLEEALKSLDECLRN
jgi:selenocysteine lyase/cysteine desulfurase